VLVRRVWRSSTFRAAVAFGVFGLAFAGANLLFARVLPPSQYALVALAVAIIQVCMPLGPAGADVVINRRHLAPTRALLARVLLSSTVVAAAGLFVTAFVYSLSPALVAAVVLATVAGGANYAAAAVYQSRHEMRRSILVSETQNLVLALGGLAVLATGIRAAWLPCAVYSLGYLVSASAAWSRLLGGPADPSASTQSIRWSEALPLMGMNAAALVMIQLERLLVPKLLSLGDLARFGVLAVVAGAPFRVLQMGVGYTMLPRLRAARTGPDRVRLLLEEGGVVLGLSVLAAAAVFVLTPFVTEVILRGKYDLPRGLIAVAVLAGIAKVAAGFTAGTANAICREDQLLRLTLLGWLGILAGVAGAFLGVPWGLEGVIAGVALGWLFRACAALWVAAPNLRRTYAA
jgi:hypothetical protein